MALRRSFAIDLSEPLLTVADVAKWSGLTPKTIYRAIDAKHIECLRLGPTGYKGGIRFTRQQMEAWLRRKTQAAEF